MLHFHGFWQAVDKLDCNVVWSILAQCWLLQNIQNTYEEITAQVTKQGQVSITVAFKMGVHAVTTHLCHYQPLGEEEIHEHSRSFAVELHERASYFADEMCFYSHTSWSWPSAFNQHLPGWAGSPQSVLHQRSSWKSRNYQWRGFPPDEGTC